MIRVLRHLGLTVVLFSVLRVRGQLECYHCSRFLWNHSGTLPGEGVDLVFLSVEYRKYLGLIW
jgi:hypothetical protein